MCMRQRWTPDSAITPASSGSARRAVTSLTISAPIPIARRATSAFEVSIETGISPASRSRTGTTRRSSSSAVTPPEPGLVDSPPTSTIAAPSSSIRRAEAAAVSGSRLTPPSENESGVTLTTPITDGRGKRSSIGITRDNVSAASASDHALSSGGAIRAIMWFIPMHEFGVDPADEGAVRERAFAISETAAAGTPEENWLRAERELHVAHGYDTVDRDLERVGMTIARLPAEAGVVWRLSLPRGERVEAWEPGNDGLAPPDEIS